MKYMYSPVLRELDEDALEAIADVEVDDAERDDPLDPVHW